MKTVLVILFVCHAFLCIAQPGDLYSKSNSFIDFKDAKTKLFGFKNAKGKIVVPAIYSEVSFETTWAKWTVKKDSMIGLYALDGTLILQPLYRWIEPHYDMDKEYIVVSKDFRNYGLTDLKGKKLLDLKYPRILDIYKNLLLVGESNRDSIYNKMIIDTLQNVILDEKIIHAEIYGFVEDHFYDSTGNFYLQAIKNEKFALFANTGRQISDFIYAGLSRSRRSLIMGRLSRNGGNCGIIDQNNKTIIPFKYSFAGVFDNGSIRADTEEGQSFYFNSEGKTISEEEFKVINVNHPYWKTN
ncbi:MAG: WG repeat-containing protein [Bacteroidota bacterium]|nr:WG repeat-containing protein [Bacteroidota bacterium]